MTDRLTILIVGGYGTFGGRTIELLEGEPRLTLIVGGRSLERAARYCASRTEAKATLIPAAFDRDGDIAAQLRALQPDLLVDASGPFQAYGERPYRVIEACIANAVNYLDLADGSDFVAGMPILDSVARAVGVFALSGVSSFPVLTAAVVRRLSADLTHIDAIRGGIAPSPHAGVGENVIRAIAGYAGQQVPLRSEGKDGLGYPFTQHMRFTVAPAGRLPLHSTWFSLVDVPDLKALAELWPQARGVWMGAGPVPEVLHRALAMLAWLVRLKLVRSLLPFAPLMRWAMNRLRWGEHRGGMFVEVEGAIGTGAHVKRSWHLLAEGDDGPLIPSMAIAAIVRRMLDGDLPRHGARVAVREIDLQEYERLFEDRAIQTSTWETPRADLPLYSRLLGQVWYDLPAEIKAMHEVTGTVRAEGHASVMRGKGTLANFASRLFGFPVTSEAVPVSVRFDEMDGAETWTRTFLNKPFTSHQFAGTGQSERLLCERFGPLTFAMALVVDGNRLRLVVRRWSFLGLGLPLGLAPIADAYEAVENGRFTFHVEISHRFTGLIVRYRGWLKRSAD